MTIEIGKVYVVRWKPEWLITEIKFTMLERHEACSCKKSATKREGNRKIKYTRYVSTQQTNYRGHLKSHRKTKCIRILRIDKILKETY